MSQATDYAGVEEAALQLHIEREEYSLEFSWEISLDPRPTSRFSRSDVTC